MYLIDIDQFIGHEEYQALVTQYEEHIKSARRLPGVDEILLPGEIERRRADVRRAEGVTLPDETWRQISELADRLGVSIQDL